MSIPKMARRGAYLKTKDDRSLFQFILTSKKNYEKDCFVFDQKKKTLEDEVEKHLTKHVIFGHLKTKHHIPHL